MLIWASREYVLRAEPGELDAVVSRHFGHVVEGVYEAVSSSPAAGWYGIELDVSGRPVVLELGDYGPGGTFPILTQERRT